MNNKTSQPLRIEDWMTRTPCLVDEGLSVADAQQRMYVNNIRHLAVVRGERMLVGVVSSRDLAVAAAVSNKDSKIPLSDAMVDDPYTCRLDASLEDVVYEMEAHRYGCAIVLEDDNRPIGIFTTTDALRALRQLIAGRPVEAASPPTHVGGRSKERKHVELRVHSSDRVAGPSPNQGKIRF